MRRQLGQLGSTCHELGPPLCVAGSIAPACGDGAALQMPPSIPLPHVSAQLVKHRRGSSAESSRYQPDRITTLHTGVDLFSLDKRQKPAAGLCSDVSRNHAASLPEPEPSCLPAIAGPGLSTVGQSRDCVLNAGASANSDPELPHDIFSRWEIHRTPPSFQS